MLISVLAALALRGVRIVLQHTIVKRGVSETDNTEQSNPFWYTASQKWRRPGKDNGWTVRSRAAVVDTVHWPLYSR